MRAPIVIALAALAACAAPTRWQQSGVTQERLGQDMAYCRGRVRAAMRTHETFAREHFHGRALDAESPLADGRAVDRRFREQEIGRLRDRLFAGCMTDLGYRKAG